MCRIFQIHKSSFFRWRKRTPTAKSVRKAHIIKEIIRIYHWSQSRYGSPRIAKELDSIGIKVSRKFVGQIMKENHLRSIAKSKYKKTTSPPRNNRSAENRLEQIFKAARRNEIWVSDITYIETDEGWIYLTVVIDLFDRKVIGFNQRNNESKRYQHHLFNESSFKSSIAEQSGTTLSLRPRKAICLP